MILDRSTFFCISMQKYLMDVLKSFDHNLKTFDRNALNALVSFHSHIWKILSSRHPYHKYCDCIFFQKKVQPRWLRDAKNTTRRSLGVVTEETYKAQKKTIIERTDWARYHRKNTHRIFDRALIRSSIFLTVGRRARSSNFACSSATKTLLARESLPLSFTMHPISKVLHARPEPVTQFPPPPRSPPPRNRFARSHTSYPKFTNLGFTSASANTRQEGRRSHLRETARCARSFVRSRRLAAV